MRLLAIDYGESKVGIAVALDAPIAEPLTVIYYTELEELLVKVKKLTEIHEIDKIVVGISENDSGRKSDEFAQKLEDRFHLPVEREDETLSSRDAQILAKQAGIKRSKRKGMEDAYAATIFLQTYIDRLSF